MVIALIAVVVALLFLMNGLIGQFNREPVLAVDQIGGDRSYVVALGSSGTMAGLLVGAALAALDAACKSVAL